jgi:outer membrane protein OmpA-like peptidoglycan-associated protein
MRSLISSCLLAATLTGCASAPPDKAPDAMVEPEPSATPVTFVDGQPGCSVKGVAYGERETFALDGQLCGCAQGELLCRPGQDVACFAAGEWVEEGGSTLHTDGCNSVYCEGGRWGRMTLLSCDVAILEKIYFEQDSPAIFTDAFPLLDALSDMIVEHPEVGLITIEGHADGLEAEAEALSVRRAEAVRGSLLARGVPADRLAVRGFGATMPVAAPGDPDAEERNRRVEFKVERTHP